MPERSERIKAAKAFCATVADPVMSQKIEQQLQDALAQTLALIIVNLDAVHIRKSQLPEQFGGLNYRLPGDRSHSAYFATALNLAQRVKDVAVAFQRPVTRISHAAEAV